MKVDESRGNGRRCAAVVDGRQLLLQPRQQGGGLEVGFQQEDMVVCPTCQRW
jgi:hypothetical protein